MSSEPAPVPKHLLARTVLRVLKPLARLAIRAGITHSEFSDLSKMAFVDAASRDYGLRGRPANKSRIAILTGIGRKQVKQYLDRLADEEITNKSQVSPATRVISAWHKDPEFLNEQGQPLPLKIEDGHPSFASIVKRYAGDIPATALLSELLRVNAVERVGNEHIRVISRVFLTTSYDPDHIRVIGTQLSDLGNTALHNLDPPEGSEKWLQRYVFNNNMSPKAVKAFQQLAKEKTQKLLEEFDEWLVENEQRQETPSRQPVMRTGVGVYYFEQRNTQQDENHE